MGYSIKAKAKSKGQAIRFNCLECMGGHDGYKDQRGNKVESYRPHALVAACTATACHLWPYRFGRDPEIAARRAERIREANEVVTGERPKVDTPPSGKQD